MTSPPQQPPLSRPGPAWFTVGSSVKGSAHAKRDLPCQDAHHVEVISDNVLAILVADGLGSARRSELGSLAAVRGAADCLRNASLPSMKAEAEVWSELFRTVFRQGLAAVHLAAVEGGLTERDLATTLVVALVHPDLVAAAQIGDGGVVGAKETGELVLLSSGPDEEYVNEVETLTGERAIEHLSATIHRDRYASIAAFTDGVELISMESSGAPSPGFFDGMFDFVRKVDATIAKQELETFLGDDEVRRRTDDDVTIVLATRSRNPEVSRAPVVAPDEYSTAISPIKDSTSAGLSAVEAKGSAYSTAEAKSQAHADEPPLPGKKSDPRLGRNSLVNGTQSRTGTSTDGSLLVRALYPVLLLYPVLWLGSGFVIGLVAARLVASGGQATTEAKPCNADDSASASAARALPAPGSSPTRTLPLGPDAGGAQLDMRSGVNRGGPSKKAPQPSAKPMTPPGPPMKPSEKPSRKGSKKAPDTSKTAVEGVTPDKPPENATQHKQPEGAAPASTSEKAYEELNSGTKQP